MSRHLRRLVRHGVTVMLSTVLWLASSGAALAAAGDGGSWQAAPYSLGQGLYFPSQGLRIGGYADLHFYSLKGSPDTYSFRDLSLFVTKDIGSSWQFFTELEAGSFLDVSGSHTDAQEAEIDVERLYLDYHAGQSVSFRFGKFLTPVGEWNLVHADPLTWTVSRPLSTSAAFARHAAGAMMFGTLPMKGNDLDYWVFADDSKALSFGQEQDDAYPSFGVDQTLRNNFRQAIGARVLYHMLGDTLNVGLSTLNYELQSPHQKYLLSGIDFSWTSRYVNLTGEGIYRSSTDNRPDERGGFIEAELPLMQRLYLIGRYERYRSSTPAQTTTIRTEALNYRPIEGIVLKLEYRDGTHNELLAPTGWLASVAVLF
ncbi:porin [Dyella soli]|uniref:Porin n=1 Tax=Dyella soli TaxID=522319 RepID=A0A4R0YSC7_9GAMM|nr:porin [Dyella soli]TCI08822.1 hypothetical protein EZM97_21450 [Dyella soli]